jgi:hypothetical protein
MKSQLSAHNEVNGRWCLSLKHIIRYCIQRASLSGFHADEQRMKQLLDIIYEQQLLFFAERAFASKN